MLWSLLVNGVHHSDLESQSRPLPREFNVYVRTAVQYEVIEVKEAEVSYSEFVATLIKPGVDILSEMSPADANLMHMAIGVAGEGGELLDAIKRRVIYRKQLDIENVTEELGDLEFFMEGVRAATGITREQCLAHNRAKLAVRYESLTYSNQAASDRADKSA